MTVGLVLIALGLGFIITELRKGNGDKSDD